MLTLNHVSSLYGKRKRCKPVCLFGAPDPLETEKSYEEAFMANRDNFQKRWNFDVYTMEPSSLPGGLQWSATSPKEERVEETTTSGEERLTAAPVATTTTTTSPEGRIRESNPEVNPTSSPVGSRTVNSARYSPYHKQQTLTDFWRSKKAPSQTSLKNRLSRKSEDSIAHTHTHAQRESANVTI